MELELSVTRTNHLRIQHPRESNICNPPVGNRYQGTICEDTEDRKDLACALMICKLPRTAMTL
jgi:hypothetical protein